MKRDWLNFSEGEKALMRAPDVVKSVNAWTETTMQGKDLVVNQGGQGEVVKQVRERFPHIRIPVLA